jgi:HK97 family phage prohead protease
MERKILKAPFEVKEVDVKERTFEGYASVFDVMDEDGDIVEKGAFKKTIAERVASKKVKILDHHRYGSTETVLGYLAEAKEDNKGLWIKAYLSDTVFNNELLTKIKDGTIDALSFGYDVIRKVIEEGEESVVRKLQELKLWEVSTVTWGANPLALITPGSVKSKAVPPMQSFPLADRERAWDSTAAIKRLRKFVSSDGSGDKDKINWTQYRKYFFWYDAQDQENFGSYKLAYTDVIDGRVKTIPRGVFAVAAVLQGARGGVDISSSDEGKIRSQVEKWYRKMDLEAPWKGLVFLSEAKKLIEKQEMPVLSEKDMSFIKEVCQSLTAFLASANPPDIAIKQIEGTALVDMSDAMAKMRGIRRGLIESGVK